MIDVLEQEPDVAGVLRLVEVDLLALPEERTLLSGGRGCGSAAAAGAQHSQRDERDGDRGSHARSVAGLALFLERDFRRCPDRAHEARHDVEHALSRAPLEVGLEAVAAEVARAPARAEPFE